MLSLNNEKIKQTLDQLLKKYNKSIDLINENIENLKNFSEILEINSIVKLDTNYPNDLSLMNNFTDEIIQKTYCYSHLRLQAFVFYIHFYFLYPFSVIMNDYTFLYVA